MKILEVIPQLGSGGAERFIVDLSNEMSLNNNDITLCVFHSLEKSGFYKEDINRNVKLISLEKSLGFNPLLLFRIIKLIRKVNPDVVHTHLHALEYLLLAYVVFPKIQFFHTVHNDAFIEAGGRVGLLLRKILFKLSLVTPVTISQESTNSFLKAYHLKPKLIVNGRNIPQNLSVSDLVKNEVRNYKTTDDSIVLVQLAHVGFQKRQDVMARVINRLTKEGYHVTLLMIGNIDDKDMANEIRNLKNPNIRLLGVKHNPLEYLKVADAFVLCSSYEGMPISLIEAIGVGAVPICTPVGGIVDVIKNGINGYLSEDISEESYYQAVKKYLDLPTNKKYLMRKNTLDSYSPYTMTKCALNYLDFFSDKK